MENFDYLMNVTLNLSFAFPSTKPNAFRQSHSAEVVENINEIKKAKQGNILAKIDKPKTEDGHIFTRIQKSRRCLSMNYCVQLKSDFPSDHFQEE